MATSPLILGSDSETCAGEYRSIAIQSDDIDHSLSFMKKLGIKNLTINTEKGWDAKQRDLNFLINETWIEGVDIADNDFNVEAINNLSKLKRILLPDRYQGVIDLINFPNLESLAAPINEKKLLNLHTCKNLRYIRIDHLTTNDLSLLSSNKELEELHLLYSKVNSLRGLNDLKKLSKIFLHHLPKLEDISAVFSLKLNLRTLFIEGCKNIKTYQGVEELIKIKRFQVLNSTPLHSVAFLDKFRDLEICYIGVEVLDHNIEILKSRGIGYKKYLAYGK